VIGCREVYGDIETVVDSFLKLRDKETPTVRDNRVRKAVELPDILNKVFS